MSSGSTTSSIQPNWLHKSWNQAPSLWIVSLAFLAGFVILGANTLTLYHSFDVFRQNEGWVRHTNEVITEIDSTLSSVKDGETGQRGFVITGDGSFLDVYSRGFTAATRSVDHAFELTADNPAQHERVGILAEQVKKMFARFEEVISIRKSAGFEKARDEIATKYGKMMMDDLRVKAEGLKRTELKLLEERTERARDSRDDMNRALGLETFAIIAFLVSVYFLVRRNILRHINQRSLIERDNWKKDGLSKLNEKLRGSPTVSMVSHLTLEFFAKYFSIPAGTFYVFDGSYLIPSGGYAGADHITNLPRLYMGQGLVGEAAKQRRMLRLDNVPSDFLKISSSLGESAINHTLAIPIVAEENICGVLELGSQIPFTDLQIELLNIVSSGLGVTLEAAQSRAKLQDLLEETQRQAEELTSQQEELRSNNEELETQTEELKTSQERLLLQQEELRQTNEELEQQKSELEMQKQDLERKNVALQVAQRDIQVKARDLEQASKYKSEFLANMSHELRTPLNSLLILSTLLSENSGKNLTEKQVDFAKTIYRSGNDLLNLINDILDLSKVEAGKLDIHIAPIDFHAFCEDMRQIFSPLAEQKGLKFLIEVNEATPKNIMSDNQRLQQILKNFLSNAIKFTEHGSVEVKLSPSKEATGGVEISVSDSGIGIPQDKLDLVFEAFQQADGSTSREYGGTGLGLTISRELSSLLGCQIKVSSALGRGSVFTLVVPPHAPQSVEDAAMAKAARPVLSFNASSEHAGATDAAEAAERKTDAKVPVILEGDLKKLSESDRVIVIIEDDPDFGKILMQQAKEAGFDSVLTNSGEKGAALIESHHVQGVLLDLKLPDISGLTILERLKGNPLTRHVPIHIISGIDRSQNALKMGAIGYLMKPVSREDLTAAFARIQNTLSKRIKKVLIVEDDFTQRNAMVELLGDADVEIDAVGLGSEAVKRLDTGVYDCMILDLRLPDISGFDLLELLDRKDIQQRPPVVVYTGKELTKAELDRLRKYSESIIIKGAKSPERLLDEVGLFLHRVESKMQPVQQALLRQLRDSDSEFSGRRVLLVDDDMRNVFALANALESKGIKIIVGKNGREAIDLLHSTPDIDLVLMDIMMPQMDGYEAMQHIRKNPKFKRLPIIALTAKAMKGDFEKCIDAGANDYLSKPVDLSKLLPLMKVWMPQRNEI